MDSPRAHGVIAPGLTQRKRRARSAVVGAPVVAHAVDLDRATDAQSNLVPDRPAVQPGAIEPSAVLPPFDPWRASAVSFDVIAASRATPEGVRQRQVRRLADLLLASTTRSRFYRELMGAPSKALPLLREWPVVTKRALMNRFDDWVTDPCLHLDELRRFTASPSCIAQPFHERYIVWESSGSSGEPGVFVQDAHALAVSYALEALRPAALQPWRRMLDPYYLCERLAFVGAINGHFASTVSLERLRRISPGVAATVRSFSFLQRTADLVAQLNDHAPTIVATYPTAALMLAEEAEAGRLRIAPQEIWTGGEALTPAVRRFVSARFHCPVSNSYGASEFLAMASECRLGHMHLNSDWVILESVDSHGRPVPAGESGSTTLLTNLSNHVQPLIRYDLGDRLTVAPGRCACGSPFPVIRVVGRVDDSLLLHDAHGRAVRLLPLALTTVVEDEAGVFDFQIEQQDATHLLLRIAVNGGAGRSELQRARTALGAYLLRQGLANVHIHGRCGEPGVRGRSGKVPRVRGVTRVADGAVAAQA